MKRTDIDPKLFEELIGKVIAGEINRKQITREYHISSRTINLMITELSKTNPELYMRFIERFPYKPKEIENIDFVELVKEIMKQDKTIEDLSITYGVSTRTIRRRIGKMKDSNEIEISSGMTLDELYHLYKRYRAEDLSIEDKSIIQAMKVGKIQNAPNSQDARKNYLADLIARYNEYRRQGMSTRDAAKMLGYSFLDIYKKQGELERIITEQERTNGASNNANTIKTKKVETPKEKMQLFKGSLKFLTKASIHDSVVQNNPTRATYKIGNITRGVREK